MSYYIGLSLLSNVDKSQKKLYSAESRRILSIFENKQIDENDFSREAQGRPFLPGRDIDFNISHSGNAAAVSYVNRKGYRAGCDIEQVRPRSRTAAIAKDKFSESENNFLFLNGGFSEIDFYKLWTLKECYIKLRGLSVFDMEKVPSFISNENIFSFNENNLKPLTFRVYELSDNNEILYILSEAIEGGYLQPEIRWFSSLSLDCKMIAEIKAAPNPAHTVSPNK